MCFSFFSFGQCGNDKTVLFFANGMFNSLEEAQINLDYLSKSYTDRFIGAEFTEKQIAYNTDEMALVQLLQVYLQKAEDIHLGFWRWLGRFAGFENDSQFIKDTEKFYSEQRARDKDLSIQIRKYKEYLEKGFKVITVGHSQGNFYTLFSFEQIKSQATKMVSVATPAMRVYEEGPYYTFRSDGVITPIPTALIANREKENPGYFDHKFFDDYLMDKKVGSEILESVFKYTQSEEDPQPSRISMMPIFTRI